MSFLEIAVNLFCVRAFAGMRGRRASETCEISALDTFTRLAYPVLLESTCDLNLSMVEVEAGLLYSSLARPPLLTNAPVVTRSGRNPAAPCCDNVLHCSRSTFCCTVSATCRKSVGWRVSLRGEIIAPAKRIEAAAG
jgi:hypothetical protein